MRPDHSPVGIVRQTSRAESDNQVEEPIDDIHRPYWRSLFRRDNYHGALLFNLATFILPALYGTLSKLWVAKIDSSMVVMTDAFTYINTASEAVNEGLPRAAWMIIGDKASRTLVQRLQLTHTLILFQVFVGLILSIIFVGAASSFAKSFVPVEVRAVSLTYVRIASFTVLSGTIETAVETATRALDKPDVPLVISSIKFAINIILDFLIISKFHVGSHKPTVNMQGAIQLACSLTAAFAGLAYFLWSNSLPVWRKIRHQVHEDETNMRPNWRALVVFLRPGAIFFTESAIRNILYLWLVSTIVALGSVYATAWGVFNTIRWGLIMVPVLALEATSLQFISHEWGYFRERIGIHTRRPRANWKDIFTITKPAFKSLAIALLVEVPVAIFLSLYGARPFARYLSGSDEVAKVTAYMWKTIDWCYCFYAMSTQLATILTATRPKWYLYQSLVSNLLYVLPWAIVCQVKDLNEDNAWSYHRLVFGGSLVFSFVDVLVVDGIWAWTLRTGRARLEAFRG